MRLGDAIGLVCASPANPDCNRRLDLFVTRRERRDDDEVWFVSVKRVRYQYP